MSYLIWGRKSGWSGVCIYKVSLEWLIDWLTDSRILKGLCRCFAFFNIFIDLWAKRTPKEDHRRILKIFWNFERLQKKKCFPPFSTYPLVRAISKKQQNCNLVLTSRERVLWMILVWFGSGNPPLSRLSRDDAR